MCRRSLRRSKRNKRLDYAARRVRARTNVKSEQILSNESKETSNPVPPFVVSLHSLSLSIRWTRRSLDSSFGKNPALGDDEWQASLG